MKKRRTRQMQFNAAGSFQHRRFERLMLLNRRFNTVVAESGKLLLSALIWPRFVAPFRWRLRRLEMPLRNLGRAFEGYRVLQLTDLHLGRTHAGYVQQVVEASMATRPDLVVITGDLIDYDPVGLVELPGILRRIVAPDGVVAIFGNHDYREYSWNHVGARSAHRAIHKRLVRILHEHGVRLLRNQRHVVKRGGEELTLVGLDEMWADRADAEAAFAGVRAQEPVICLQHNPDGYKFLAKHPWQWMLCGHSHGGQANFPVIGPLYVPMENREWLRGLFYFEDATFGRRTMYVSTGIGYSTPIRMRVPPETTLFSLRSEG